MGKKVKIKMTAGGFCRYTGPSHREFSDEQYEALSRKFGAPGFGWHPVTSGAIKAFYEDRWHYFGSVAEALGA